AVPSRLRSLAMLDVIQIDDGVNRHVALTENTEAIRLGREVTGDASRPSRARAWSPRGSKADSAGFFSGGEHLSARVQAQLNATRRAHARGHHTVNLLLIHREQGILEMLQRGAQVPGIGEVTTTDSVETGVTLARGNVQAILFDLTMDRVEKMRIERALR